MSRRRTPGGWVARRDGSRAWRLPYRTPEGRQTSATFGTKGEAEAFLDDLRAGTRAGTWIRPDAGRERFIDFAERWGEAQDWAPSTREGFISQLHRLERYLGDARIDEVDQLRLQRLRSELVRDYALNTATITLHYATTVMRAAHVGGRIARDVTLGVKPPKRRGEDAGAPVGPDEVPTRDEVLAIVADADPRYRAVMVLGACGLRVSEAIGVTVQQLDLDHRLLNVDRQLVRIDGQPTFKLPKREKTRTIELPSWAALELRRHLRDQQPFWPMRGGEGDLLFRGNRDAPVRRDSFYDAAWRPALRAAGLVTEVTGDDGRVVEDFAFTFHALRHWCASALLAAGAPITAVAGHLGDVPETIMRTYAHWLRDERHLPAELLDRMLAAPAEAVVTGS